MPLLKLEAIEKSFAGVRALKPLDLEIAPGEVLGLVGENGAGKSTLIKILSGVHQPDAGTILWKGKPARFGAPHEALAAGIATIHQELAYFGHLSVAENLMLGESWPRRAWGGVNVRALHEEAERRLARFEIPLTVSKTFRELSSAEKQEAAIARALARNARLVILDEPTASLSGRECERLFQHLRRLRDGKTAIIYVSHRLDEILKLCDRIAVLRDGELVAAYPAREAGVERIVRDMVGRPLDQVYPKTRSATPGEPLLELNRAGRAGMFRNITFSLRAGEILGLAGLVGAGRSELARAIYGLYPLSEGEMKLRGGDWRPRGADEALRAGLVYLPEERKRQGLVQEHSLGMNLSIGFSDLISRWGWIRGGLERLRVNTAIETYRIRARSARQEIAALSGGNQQKALLARWLTRGPEIIILDEPTRGVDIGAKAEIHALIDRLAGAGKAILLISSDLPEILGMSDRLLVMRGGEIAAELEGAAMTAENVIRAASGAEAAPARPS